MLRLKQLSWQNPGGGSWSWSRAWRMSRRSRVRTKRGGKVGMATLHFGTLAPSEGHQTLRTSLIEHLCMVLEEAGRNSTDSVAALIIHWSHLTLNRWHCRGKTCCVITTWSYWLPICSPFWSLLSRWLSICSPPEISGARDCLLRLLEHALRWTYPASQGTPGLRGRKSIIVKHGWCSDMRGIMVFLL